MGNNPMVGATVAVAVAIEKTHNNAKIIFFAFFINYIHPFLEIYLMTLSLDL